MGSMEIYNRPKVARTMSGKGSKQRPTQVPAKQFEENWDLAFGKKQPELPIVPSWKSEDEWSARLR